jgi:hypothetical protein
MHQNIHPSARWIVAFTTLGLMAFAGTGCSARSRVARTLAEADRAYDANEYEPAEIEYKTASTWLRSPGLA